MKRILSLLLVLVVLTLALASCGEDPVLIYEERSTVTATKGIDYDIDYVKVSITDKASGNGDVTYMDYDDFCEELEDRKALDQEIYFRITVKFTSRVELQSAAASTIVSFWSEEKSENVTFSGRTGNSALADPSLKTDNLRPGVHYITIDGKIESSEKETKYVKSTINNFDSINDELKFSFLKYA